MSAFYIDEQPRFTIERSTISGNQSGDSGGAINFGGFGLMDVEIVDSTLASNSARIYGGAIHLYGNGYDSSLTITQYTISDNSSGLNGGGIYGSPQ